MERIIAIADYHQRKNNSQILFDKQITNLPMCTNPWKRLVINEYGLTYICSSPAWLPKSIGSILEYTDMFDLLNSYEARSIRSEVETNRYTYCNHKICGYLSPNRSEIDIQVSQSSLDSMLLTEEQFTLASRVTKLPSEICFDFDYTCNFKCPSCRTDIVNHNMGPQVSGMQQLVEKIKHLILDKYNETNTPLTIRWAGGEPFVSHAYLELWKYIVSLNNKLIKNVIQTNGSYLMKRSNLLTNFLPFVDEMRISFDAGSADTYKAIRVNGEWNSLMDNCRYMKTLRDNQKGRKIRLSSDFLVQLDNYKEIPQYIEVAKSLGFDKINLTKMWNWGTGGDDEFSRINVSDPAHPEYQLLIDIVSKYNLDPMVHQSVY